MGRPSLTVVIRRLQEAGFRAGRAYPGRRMPRIQIPAVTVAIHRDEETSQCLAVTVFCPEAMGGTKCEDNACLITKTLRTMGYSCIQEDCQYDGKGDRFFIRILATWVDPKEMTPYTVFISSTTLHDLTSVTVREQAPTGAATSPSWIITLEECFLPGHVKTPNPQKPFPIIIRWGSVGEHFINCHWVQTTWVDSPEAVKLKRVCISSTKEIINYSS